MKWIKTKKALPPRNLMNVLIRTKNYGIKTPIYALAYRHDDRWWNREGIEIQSIWVTHWKEIEEPEDEMD